MKYLSNYKLFEESKFPTAKTLIGKICNKYNITDYEINPDGSVDINGSVIFDQLFTKLPLKFGKVSGDFYCSDNKLTTLEGAPNEVGRSFDCSYNKLTSLEGAPKEVGLNFDCSWNKLLTTLEGAPKEVGENFYCHSNQLTSLIGAPDKVPANFVCRTNKLINLVGAPKEVGGDFTFWDNPVYKIFLPIFKTEGNLFKSLEYNYFMGDNKIYESRFVNACDDLGISAPDQIEGYVWV